MYCPFFAIIGQRLKGMDSFEQKKRIVLQIDRGPTRFRSSYVDLLNIELDDGEINAIVMKDVLLRLYERNEIDFDTGERTNSIFYDNDESESILAKTNKLATKKERQDRIYLPIRIKTQSSEPDRWYMLYINAVSKRIYFYSNSTEEEQLFYKSVIKTIFVYFNIPTDFKQFIVTLKGKGRVLNRNDSNIQYLSVVQQLYKIRDIRPKQEENNIFFIERNSLSLTRSQIFDTLFTVYTERASAKKNVFNVLVPFLANFKEKVLPIVRSLTDSEKKESFIVQSIELCRLVLQKIGVIIYSFISDMKKAMNAVSEQEQMTAIMRIYSNQDNVVNNQNEKFLVDTNMASAIQLEDVYINGFIKLEKDIPLKYGNLEWEVIVYSGSITNGKYRSESSERYEKYTLLDKPVVSEKEPISSRIFNKSFLQSFTLIEEDYPYNRTQTKISDLVALYEHIDGLTKADRTVGFVSNNIIADMVSLLMPDPRKEPSGALTGNLFFIPLFWQNFILPDQCPPILKFFLKSRLKTARLVTIPILDTINDTWTLVILYILPNKEIPTTFTVYLSVWTDHEHVNMRVSNNYLSPLSVAKGTLSYQHYFSSYVKRYFAKHRLISGGTHKWANSDTHKIAVKVTESKPKTTTNYPEESRKMRRKLQFMIGLNAFYRNRFDLLRSTTNNYTVLCLYFSDAQRIDNYISVFATDPNHPESPESIFRGVSYTRLGVNSMKSILLTHTKQVFNLQPVQFMQNVIDDFTEHFSSHDIPIDLNHLPIEWVPFFTQFQSITKSGLTLNEQLEFTSLADLLNQMKYPVDSGQKSDLQTIERKRLCNLLDKRLLNIIVAFVIEEDIPTTDSEGKLNPHAILIGTEKYIVESYQSATLPIVVDVPEEEEEEIIQLPVTKDEPMVCEITGDSRSILPFYGNLKVPPLVNSKRIILLHSTDEPGILMPDITENGVFQNNSDKKENESFSLKQFLKNQRVPSSLYTESIRLVKSEELCPMQNEKSPGLLPSFESRSVPPMSNTLTYQLNGSTGDSKKQPFITIPTNDYFERFENRPISPILMTKNDKRSRPKPNESLVNNNNEEEEERDEERERLINSVWSSIFLHLHTEKEKVRFLSTFKATDQVFIGLTVLMKTEKDPEPDVHQVLTDIASLYYDEEKSIKEINEALRSMWKKKALEQSQKKQKLSSVYPWILSISWDEDGEEKKTIPVQEDKIIEIKVSIGLFGGYPRRWFSYTDVTLLISERQTVRDLLREVTDWVNSQKSRYPIRQKITLKSLQMQDFEPTIDDLDKQLGFFHLPLKGLILHLWNPMLSD